jgi:2-amino-4-hydroxy-6-hydroxymethyldihydropteridine diphosphokinase
MANVGRAACPVSRVSAAADPTGQTTTQTAIALGSNLGDSYQILIHALEAIARSPHITLLAQSSIYRTQAVGPPQPDYLNACALLDTSLSPQALLQRLLSLETQFGRVRRERWGPRLLDLDLLLFGDRQVQTPTLEIPHPRMAERAFVLIPLAEIAADWIDPRSGQAIAHLLQHCDCSGVQQLEHPAQ